MADALRKSADAERRAEEKRLRKRQARTAPDGTPRSASVVPGTPGSVAPEAGEKAPTKKEQKKKEASKQSEAQSHAQANVSANHFLGGGSSLFGGKKKKYSWMESPGAANGPSRLNTKGLAPAAPSTPQELTSDSRKRMGQWREDEVKGKGMQLRDLVSVLADEGKEVKALQRAYAKLDQSNPK